MSDDLCSRFNPCGGAAASLSTFTIYINGYFNFNFNFNFNLAVKYLNPRNEWQYQLSVTKKRAVKKGLIRLQGLNAITKLF